MNIRILKNTQEFNGVLLKNNIVLETKFSKSQFNGINAVRYFLYDLETNSREEILPKIKKYNLLNIVDAAWDSKYIYFTNCGVQFGNIRIKIFRYDYLSKQFDVIYSFVDSLYIIHQQKQIKIFILNDSYFIFQSAHLKSNEKYTFKDFLNFELFLFNIKENSEIKIVDENLSNNGIDSIIPISDTHSVLKTGYSLLTNERFKYLEKEEACVEAISIVNIQQLISDLLLIDSNIDIDTIDQAFFNKTFSYVLVKGDYMVYSSVNFELQEEEIFFYNYITKETRTCINQNVYRSEDLARPYIIENTPYIRLNNQKGTEFFNLDRSKIDIRFDSDVEVSNVIDNIFIVSGMIKKGLVKKYRPYLSIYKYPQMNILHQEKAFYLGGIRTDEENLYIFVK